MRKKMKHDLSISCIDMLCMEIFFFKKKSLIASVLHLPWTISIVVSITATVYWLLMSISSIHVYLHKRK